MLYLCPSERYCSQAAAPYEPDQFESSLADPSSLGDFVEPLSDNLVELD